MGVAGKDHMRQLEYIFFYHEMPLSNFCITPTAIHAIYGFPGRKKKMRNNSCAQFHSRLKDDKNRVYVCSAYIHVNSSVLLYYYCYSHVSYEFDYRPYSTYTHISSHTRTHRKIKIMYLQIYKIQYWIGMFRLVPLQKYRKQSIFGKWFENRHEKCI